MTYSEWAKKNKNNVAVLEWLKKNPPPKEWRGTRLSWAYAEMPDQGKVSIASAAIGAVAMGAVVYGVTKIVGKIESIKPSVADTQP